MHEGFEKHLLPRADWHPFPRASERRPWESYAARPAGAHRLLTAVNAAERIAAEPFPVLKATGFMEFSRNGNRSRFQAPFFRRRTALSALAVAECLEYRGRFLDPLADALWALCEESTWCLPAHEMGGALPDVRRPTVDLFACDTALALSELDHVLGEELAKVCPRLIERLRLEVDRRILEPFLSRDDWWWLGGPGREVNNWNAVCNAGVAACAMYLEEDSARLAAVLSKVLRTLEWFLNCYGADGGCDEGPGYWDFGVGHLVMLAEMFRSRTAGFVNLFADPRVQAMAEFPHRAHLTGDWFINFADAHPHVAFSKPVTYLFAARVESAGLRQLSSMQRDWGGTPAALFEVLRHIFWLPADFAPEPIVHRPHDWFPDMQVMIARSDPEDAGGLILAAKAGHNGEKHNHNDGGAFVVYGGGKPLVIDMGIGEYTRQTFSPQRYELLATRSLGHDVPFIGGLEQLPGPEHRAAGVRFCADEVRAQFSMDLRGFYPPAAGLRSWVRTLTLLRREREAVLEDVWDMARPAADFAIPFYTPHPVDSQGAGQAQIRAPGVTLGILTDPGLATIEFEQVPMEDESLRKTWGEALTRLWLRVAGGPPRGRLVVRLALQSA